jgi:hypothetical protein
VVQAPTERIAGLVGRAAERHRKELALLWLGREMPPWARPCPVRVTIAKRRGGATTMTFDGGTLLSQEMVLEGSLEQVLADLVPHEVTHTVLAHKFRPAPGPAGAEGEDAAGKGAPRPAGHHLPRWADEGAALLAESAASRARLEVALTKVLGEGRWLPLRRLLPTREYTTDVAALYAQGHSVVDFLVRAGGRRKFLAFLAQGERDGWDEAARAHYGYRSVDALEGAWLAEVRKGRRVATPRATAPGWEDRRPLASPREGRPPAAGPAVALARLDGAGRLTVWRVVDFYQQRTAVEGAGGPAAFELVSAVVASHHRLDEVRAYDARGKAVSAKELRELLRVGAGRDGRPAGPLQFRFPKDGTVVLALLAPPAPAAPPIAAPTPVRGAPLAPRPAPAEGPGEDEVP